MITITNVIKKYGRKAPVVSDVSFTVEKGRITGFLGPNGAGKSTTMRMIVGLDTPTSGEVTIDGKKYSDLDSPLHKVGTLLEASAIHPNRTARTHLRIIAASNGIDDKRVEDMLDLVGLSDTGKKHIGDFSLGMKQRLGIAAALLGDPEYLILDEPNNGLDPDSIRWMREFLTSLAQEGKGVLISSHQLGELSKMAQDLVVIGKGEVVYTGTIVDFISKQESVTEVSSSSDDKLRSALSMYYPKSEVTSTNKGLAVKNVSPRQVGQCAFNEGIVIFELQARDGLEDAFLKATSDKREYTIKEDKNV